MHTLFLYNIAIKYKEVINSPNALVDARSLTPLQIKSCYNVRTFHARQVGWLGALIDARMLIPIEKNSYYGFRTSRAHRVNLFYMSMHKTLTIVMFQLVSSNSPENSSNIPENSSNFPESSRIILERSSNAPENSSLEQGKERKGNGIGRVI